MTSHEQITRWLGLWRQGDEQARDRLFAALQPELRQIAANLLQRERRDHTLEPNALVNELCLRFFANQPLSYQNRAHFFAIAARIMRRILLNYARDQHREKRGGKAVQISLSEVSVASFGVPEELIALDEALKRLSLEDERKGRVVELRYFGGLENDEIAEVLGVSSITVMRDWRFAKAWLLREMVNGG